MMHMVLLCMSNKNVNFYFRNGQTLNFFPPSCILVGANLELSNEKETMTLVKNFLTTSLLL